MNQTKRDRRRTDTARSSGLRFVASVVGIALLGMLFPLAAQADSNRIRLIVAYAPGGGTDVTARAVAQQLSADYGLTVTVENKPGAAGVIAARQVTSAEADGTMVLVAGNPLLVNQVLHPEAGFSLATELSPVASVAPQSVVVVAPPQSSIQSLQQLLDHAKEKPLNYGTTGTGSLSHLAVEFIRLAKPGVKFQHIPYTGSAPALTAVMGGQIDFGSSTVPPTVALVKSGKLQPLVIASAKRSAVLPDVPTLSELGMPALPVYAWTGFFVSSRTPPEVVDRLAKQILAVAKNPVLQAKFKELGFEPENVGPKVFKEQIEAELKLWTDVADKAGLRGAK